ncbi:MAG: HDOD domain-containing protein [Methylovulum sp.]|nr:HDOD domain-containing protein [Methylovulum sp.]
MNWFTKLFFRNPKPSLTPKMTVKSPPVSTDNPFQCSKPVTVSNQKHPLTLLKKFAPLREFDDLYVENLEQQTLTYTAGSVIFRLGQKRNAVFYLLQGSIEFQPNGDGRYQLTHDSSLADLPLDSGKTFGATAIAKTDVTVLAIPGNIIQMWTNKSREQVYSVKLLELELPEQITDNRFFGSFSRAYRENKLSLPSLPHVAVNLKKAMQKDIGVKEVVDIIQIDAPIVTKLIQIANSALYAPTSNITNCHDAVSRLGLDATRNLVMGISMKQLFFCKDVKLMKIMQTLWKNSLHISSLSFVLAEECSTLNPEDALLAGLVSNIGVIPILHFAEQYPDEYADLEKLQSAIALLSPSVGSLVLHTLGFSEELGHIPMHAEDWLYESGGDKASLMDIIIMAKRHSYIGSQRTKALPYINSIPAYAKLTNGKLTPDLSLDVLQKAQKRIHAVMNIFS